uniref:Uncharacterized protein n=1 Tax=Arundo donax TaxID=35708 RepID=A0A0A9CQ36_ARUDO
MVLILAAVAVLEAEEATVWGSSHRAQVQFWRTVCSHGQTLDKKRIQELT